MENEIIEFLKESNNIENEWDDDSLAQALYAWNYIIGEDELTIGALLKTHKILMLHHKILPSERGYFRERAVYIGGHEAVSYREIRDFVESWVKDANTSIKIPGEDGKHIKLDHIQYEAIHPFIDGNGRTGRIFLNWQRVKAGLPILVIKEKEKWDYYDWFRK